jgi:hypothetical protein
MPIRLPFDRQLTPDEQRGFSIACACLVTWGRQMAAAPSLAPDGSLADALGSAQVQGMMLVATATALERTLGQGALRRPEPLGRS